MGRFSSTIQSILDFILTQSYHNTNNIGLWISCHSYSTYSNRMHVWMNKWMMKSLILCIACCKILILSNMASIIHIYTVTQIIVLFQSLLRSSRIDQSSSISSDTVKILPYRFIPIPQASRSIEPSFSITLIQIWTRITKPNYMDYWPKDSGALLHSNNSLLANHETFLM